MLALDLSAHFAESGAETVLVNEYDRPLAPWTLERSMRSARAKVPALQPGFRYHDLRHYFASLLIASGTDVKVVQGRLRHAGAETTLDTHGASRDGASWAQRGAGMTRLCERPARGMSGCSRCWIQQGCEPSC